MRPVGLPQSKRNLSSSLGVTHCTQKAAPLHTKTLLKNYSDGQSGTVMGTQRHDVHGQAERNP
jgi:hypothetical protein